MNVGNYSQSTINIFNARQTARNNESKINLEDEDRRNRDTAFKRDDLVSQFWNMTEGKNGLTYADAGVDIDAGNALVERIKPAAKRTARAGTMGGLGGFGALFDLKAAGYADPILVAATDGVGTKLRIAIDTGNVDTIGIDLVAMCVNDLVCQGAEPLSFILIPLPFHR